MVGAINKRDYLIVYAWVRGTESGSGGAKEKCPGHQTIT